MISICIYDEILLKLSYLWLNNPKIKSLTNSNTFTVEEQLKWFSIIKEKKDYHILGVLNKSIPIGACGLKNITKTDAEYWGYIGEKSFWGKGYGKKIILLMENESKKKFLKSIWLKVNGINERVISLYNKSGFKIEKQEKTLIYMRKYYD